MRMHISIQLQVTKNTLRDIRVIYVLRFIHFQPLSLSIYIFLNCLALKIFAYSVDLNTENIFKSALT